MNDHRKTTSGRCAQLFQDLKSDCLYFRGDRPCEPHIVSGVTCECRQYLRIKQRGVIIKLGAAGDVLRTTPLLRALDPLRTGAKVLWITDNPDLLPLEACEAVKPTAPVLARLAAEEWDFCWNLDKDINACALASWTRAKSHAGYRLKDGVPAPADERAVHKFVSGVDNPYSKSNTLNYVQEVFDTVGLPYERQEYWLRDPKNDSKRTAEELLPGRGWVGLNTGAGARWPTRIWPPDHWAKLIDLLKDRGLKPVILGGPEEVELNNRLAAATDCLWPNVKPLDVFYAMVARCECLVTSVTQAMHLAIAAKTPLVLFNNIFNPHEFELYGRGEVLGPRNPCDCFYDSICRTRRNCITEIQPGEVASAVDRAIRGLQPRQST
jgi:ADP-heptose:LPS heptosyltransferase